VRSRVVALVVLLGVAMAAAACGGGHGAGSDGVAGASTAAPSTAPATTSSTLTPVDQVPAVITIEYVQRVMDALDKVEGDLTRKLYADKVPTPEWRNGLMAIFDGKAFDNAEASYGR